jgi:hypothetical protein
MPDVSQVAAFDNGYTEEKYKELRQLQEVRGFQHQPVEPAAAFFNLSRQAATQQCVPGCSGQYILLSK